MKKNCNLCLAKSEKNDEFYTQLVDIEKELKYYKKFFQNKVVYCNCDKFLQEKESKFFTYFANNFKYLGLKELIISYYNPNDKGKVCFFYGDMTPDNMPNIDKVVVHELEEDGSFYSDECLSLMKRADVIVTNPPFSLFRKFIQTLVSYNKRFLVIGNKNAISCKEIFPLIKENKIWLGYTSPTEFDTPDKGITKRVSGLCRWFTNIEHDKRLEKIDLYKKYDPTIFPKYDEYDAININQVTDIPEDYYGIMGVPITFLDKYNPKQFEILGLDRYIDDNPNYGRRFKINNKEIYARILIRRIP